MMITAHKKNQDKRISATTKLNMALAAIQRKQTIVDISNHYGCSRTTVYQQQEIALEAANKAFEENDEEVLYYIPVTKSFIHQSIISLRLICASSYRNIMFYIQAMYHYSISLGTVFNVLDEAAKKAKLINHSYDLSLIKDSASDELFHWNKPILATVDIPSRFCASLTKADSRDYETWGIHLLDIMKQGYDPVNTVLDGGKGLIKGYEEVLPETNLRHDHFHIIMAIKDCCRFLSNEEASAVTAVLTLYTRENKARNEDDKQTINETLNAAFTRLAMLEETRKTFQLLAQWLQYDVLQLAGHSPETRTMLYDFIVTEMEALAVKHPHRIDVVLTSLKNQREALLGVADELNVKFQQLAAKYSISIHVLWKICYSARYSMDNVKYHEQSNELAEILGTQYDEIEDEVLHILETTHRCSSMVENFNSRLRPYLDERKFISQKNLDLTQFYLNHRPFLRSKHARLVNKTPAEALTGNTHKSWLEMLGFTPWYSQAA